MGKLLRHCQRCGREIWLDDPTQVREEMFCGLKCWRRWTVRPCSLSEYRDIMRPLPRPSREQIEDFVSYVCGAHSWYKHLPPIPPGAPFCFFLDPYAGYGIQELPYGRGERNVELTETSEKFHYSWMTTREHLRRFGYLTYALRIEEGPLYFWTPQIRSLPMAVAKAGAVLLTAVIHRYAPTPWVWTWHLDQKRERWPGHENLSWPEKTGGMARLERIIEVARWRTRAGLHDDVDEELTELLRPEKERQRAAMIRAIERMLSVVYGGANGTRSGAARGARAGTESRPPIRRRLRGDAD